MDDVDLDISDVLNVIIPGEKHIPFMNYCGPGTKLEQKLNADESPKPGHEPIDRVDEVALQHDLAYRRHSDLRNRNIADKVMIRELLLITNPSYREYFERCCVLPIIYIKSVIESFILLIIDFFEHMTINNTTS